MVSRRSRSSPLTFRSSAAAAHCIAQRRKPAEECMLIFFMTNHQQLGVRRTSGSWFGHKGIRQPTILRRQTMDLSAVWTKQTDRKLLYMRQAFQVGIDAADDVAAGIRTGKNKRTHGTVYCAANTAILHRGCL
jgi:hypothetical protein